MSSDLCGVLIIRDRKGVIDEIHYDSASSKEVHASDVVETRSKGVVVQNYPPKEEITIVRFLYQDPLPKKLLPFQLRM